MRRRGILLAVVAGLVSPVRAQVEPEVLIRKPSILLPLHGGLIIGAENGLFLRRDGTAVISTGTEQTVNDIVPGKDGYLVATDGGLLTYEPDNISTPLFKTGNYSRSVRQIYGYSEDDYFLATQDGLKILNAGVIRSLGKNAEVDTIPCVFDRKVVGICGKEIVLADTQQATFHDCGDVVTAVVPTLDRLFIATLSGVMALHAGELEPVLGNTAVSDMVSVGKNLVIATSGGLLTMPAEGPYQPSRSREGFYSDIRTFEGGLLLLGNDRLDILSDNLALSSSVPSPGARKCNKFRQEKGLLAFCLNNGLLVSTDGGANYVFTPSESEVRDVVSRGGRVMMATDGGITYLVDGPKPTPWLPVAMGMVALVITGGVLWMRSRRRVIFISYRRNDSKDIACRLRDRLQGPFGRHSIRLDLHDIEEGEDFRAEIRRNVSDSSVVLVLIGRHWASAANEDGSLRLFSEVDYVREEIEHAFHLKKPILPVLVANAEMPSAESLPPSIAELSFRQSRNLRSDPDFDADVAALVTAIRRSTRRGATPET